VQADQDAAPLLPLFCLQRWRRLGKLHLKLMMPKMFMERGSALCAAALGQRWSLAGSRASTAPLSFTWGAQAQVWTRGGSAPSVEKVRDC
jgi:hypothetical protein